MGYRAEIETLKWKENQLVIYLGNDVDSPDAWKEALDILLIRDEILMILEEIEEDAVIDKDTLINRDEVKEIIHYSLCPWRKEFLEWFNTFPDNYLPNALTEERYFKEYVMAKEQLNTTLQYERVVRGLTLKEVSSVVGISDTYLSKLENKKVKPSKRVAQELSGYYDVEIGTLFDMSYDEAEKLSDRVSRLRDYRSREGVTLKEVSDGTGLSASYLSKLELGYLDPTEKAMMLLSDYFNVSVTDIFDVEQIEDGVVDSSVSAHEENEKQKSEEVVAKDNAMIVQELRDKYGMTLKELAERTGVSASYISMVERGKRKVNEKFRLALVGEFDIELYEEQ